MKVWFISYTTPEYADVVRCFANAEAWHNAWVELSKVEGITFLWADTTEMEG